MGNSLGCSASGERLVSAARDGDAVEARMLLHLNPCLARYSTFGGLNSPLHFAAAKGHDEIVTLLLENGADINSRNYCGQTALMQACRYGHWEVVQTLMVYRSNVTRADYLNGRTALHFAATEGHVKCLRLVVADFVSSAPFRSVSSAKKEGSGDEESASSGKNYDNYALNKFVNKQADGGITALHMAALSGHSDCVHLLLDLNANASAVTFNYGSSSNLIGAGSTPLHYAACSGNLKCCQVLLARGASRLALNCNGWLPVDVARIWGRRLLEPLLSPNSEVVPPPFPPSNFLSLPLLSILDIARGCGLKHSSAVLDDNDVCAVCLERECTVAAEGCSHELCIKCALSLCSSLASVAASEIVPPGSIPCPLCRHGIVSFVKLPNAPLKEIKLGLALSLCNPCMLQSCDLTLQMKSCRSDTSNSSVVSSSSEIVCPVSCSPFPSVSAPLCACDDDSCHSHESEGVAQVQSPNHSDGSLNDLGPEERLEKTACSKMFWNRRSCHRERQCNSEIGA